MKQILILMILLSTCFSIYGQEKIKYRKLEYTDFHEQFGYNDTAKAVLDIYFDKRENVAYGQMSFLPITAGLAIIPQTRIIGIATTAISLPIFIHGCYIMIKFSKKKLHKTLTLYNEHSKLPKWLQKKVEKQVAMYKELNRKY